MGCCCGRDRRGGDYGCCGGGGFGGTWWRVDSGFLKNEIFLAGRRKDVFKPSSVSLKTKWLIKAFRRVVGLTYFLSSGVAPSTFLRTSRIKLDNLSDPISSLGFSGPKTSVTAA